MSKIKDCEFFKENSTCKICLEFYENSYVVMTTEGQKSTEIRYFPDEISASKIFNAIKNKKNMDGWKEKTT